MFGGVSNQLSTMASNLNPYKWSEQTKSKVLKATALMAITAVALTAIASLGVSAEKTDSSDANYNAMRAMQDSIEGKTDSPVFDYAVGSFVGRPALDGMKAGDKVYKETGSLVASVAANLFTTWESNRYQDCLDNADGILANIFCHLIYKPTL